MVQFFNQSKLTAAAIGNHEFDYGLPILLQRMKEAQYPYLQANIFNNQNNQDLYPFPNTYPHIIKKVGNLQVGIIGLTTLQTVTTTQPESIKGLHFGALKTAVLKESQLLRQQGAHIILLLAHAGLNCETGKARSGVPIWKPSDSQGKCHDEGEIVELLKALPKGTVEGVISGHYHKLIHHWVAGVPVLQAGAFGYYLNVLYLTYDFKNKKVLSNQTRIEGPIPVCTRVFANQNDCDGDRPAPRHGRGPLIPSSFHGKPISTDADISQLTQEIFRKTQHIKDQKLAIAVRPIENPPFTESEMGNLTADAMRYVSQADFAIINGGGIRAPLESGPITFGSLYKSIPFENAVSVIKIKENELRNIMQTLQSGDRYLSFVSGFIVKLRDLKLPAPFLNFAPAGMPEAWGHDRLIDVLSLNGAPLNPDALYSLAIPDFLVHGGANLSWVMSQIPSDRITWSIGLNTRDAVAKYLEFKQEINTADQPLVQPTARRIQFVVPNHRPNHRSTHRLKHRPSPRAAQQ